MKKSDVAKWKSGGSGERSLTPAPARSVPHREITTERSQTYLKHLADCGSYSRAAQMTDGTPNTRRAFRRLEITDAAFGIAVENALESYADKVKQVLDQEYFEGRLEPVVSKGEVVLDPKTKEPIWIRRRDSRVVLAYARKFDPQLRDHKQVSVTVDGQPSDNAAEIRIRAEDLWTLPAHEAEQFLILARKIHANRSEEMKDISPRPEYLEGEAVEEIPLAEMSVEEVMAANDL